MPEFIYSSIQQQDEYIFQKAREGYLFQTDAVDYFLFTKKNTWHLRKSVVIYKKLEFYKTMMMTIETYLNSDNQPRIRRLRV